VSRYPIGTSFAKSRGSVRGSVAYRQHQHNGFNVMLQRNCWTRRRGVIDASDKRRTGLPLGGADLVSDELVVREASLDLQLSMDSKRRIPQCGGRF